MNRDGAMFESGNDMEKVKYKSVGQKYENRKTNIIQKCTNTYYTQIFTNMYISTKNR